MEKIVKQKWKQWRGREYKNGKQCKSQMETIDRYTIGNNDNLQNSKSKM